MAEGGKSWTSNYPSIIRLLRSEKKSLLHLPVREFERKIEASRLKHYRGTLVNLLRQIKLMNFSFRFNLIVLFKDFFN